MITANLYEAKTQFSRLVSAVEKQGERIVLCRNGIPVADLVPHASIPSKKLDPDPLFAGARFVGDPTAPLEAGDWTENLR
jgi:antitoxin (DNA-binding transcriptional repressor) of toxin-antitoxin stability system